MIKLTVGTLSGFTLALLVATSACDGKPAGPSGSGGKVGLGDGGAGRGNEGASTPSMGASDSGGAAQGGEPSAGGARAGAQGVAGEGVGGTDSVCGNGELEPSEECDDSNEQSGDGCSSKCVSKCELCQRDTCPLESTYKGIAAEAFTKAFEMPGVAEAGRAINLPRASLVRDLLECVYESKCLTVWAAPGAPQYAWNVSMRDCACANPTSTSSPDEYPAACADDATRIDGPCVQQMLDAAEAETFLQMTAKIKNANFAMGRAYNLIWYCDVKVCAEQCVPDEAHELLSAGPVGSGP